jgi:hypothetical protein
MADVERVLEGLEDSFDASLAASDEEIANDLAYSILQGLDLRQALSRWPGASWRTRMGNLLAIEEVAGDHVVASSGCVIGALDRLVAVRTAGPRVERSELGMVDRLRGWARGGMTVQVGGYSGETWRGALTRVAEDHLEISWGDGATIIALAGVDSVRIDRGGSRDAR